MYFGENILNNYEISLVFFFFKVGPNDSPLMTGLFIHIVLHELQTVAISILIVYKLG